MSFYIAVLTFYEGGVPWVESAGTFVVQADSVDEAKRKVFEDSANKYCEIDELYDCGDKEPTLIKINN